MHFLDKAFHDEIPRPRFTEPWIPVIECISKRPRNCLPRKRQPLPRNIETGTRVMPPLLSTGKVWECQCPSALQRRHGPGQVGRSSTNLSTQTLFRSTPKTCSTWIRVFSFSGRQMEHNMFAELKKFKSMHGHCRVPQDSKRLGEWVHNQRTIYRQNLMDKDRQKELESVGFEWKVRNQKLDRCTQTEDQKWLENYRKLIEIHQTHGHCIVGGVAHDKLRNWLENQRAFYSKNILRKDRQELLDEVGFEWNPTKDTSYQDMWNKNFANFLEYKRTHGGCTKVPYTYTKGGLGGWASNQSQIFRDGDMEAHRARLLLDEGFPYAAEESCSWKARYEQLKAFLSSSKLRVESEPSLLRWTRLQRVLRKNNVLELSRIDHLNSIDFSWKEVGVNIGVI